MPSVPKLATLANVYQRSLYELVDLYELENIRTLVPGVGDYGHFRAIGVEALEAGDNDRAAAAFLKALDAARRKGDRPSVAAGCNNVGLAFLRSARYHASRPFLEEGLRCVEENRVRCLLLDNLSNVHYHLDDLFLADHMSQLASSLAGADPHLRSLTRTTRAAILGDLEAYDEAAKLSRLAVDEFREMGQTSYEIREMSNLGEYLVKSGQVEDGLALLRDAMARAAEHGDAHLRAQSSLYYGRCLHAIGRNHDAASPLKSALLIARGRKMRKETFHSAFYLWKLAHERGSAIEIDTYEEIIRQYRVGLEERSEEAREFDSWLAERRRKARGRTNA